MVAAGRAVLHRPDTAVRVRRAVAARRHRLDDPSSRDVAQPRADRARAAHPGRVRRARRTSTSRTPIATGLGPSRRVVLWGTIVERPFTPREVAFVLAHELGHLAHNHIWKSVGWYALFAFPGAFLIALVTRRRGGMGEPAAVPLSLFVLVVLQLLAAAAPERRSRATWRRRPTGRRSGRRTTRPARAALFRLFAPTTLDDPNPPRWDYVLLENHPTLMQRIEMAQAWAPTRRRRPSRRRATCRARGARAARRASPARRRGRARARRSGRRRGSSRAGAR